MSVINYNNISTVKVGEHYDGPNKCVHAMQIYFNNGSSLFAVFKKKHLGEKVFDGDTVKDHADTDYRWDSKPIDIKGIDKLLSMCGRFQYIPKYNS